MTDQLRPSTPTLLGARVSLSAGEAELLLTSRNNLVVCAAKLCNHKDVRRDGVA